MNLTDLENEKKASVSVLALKPLELAVDAPLYVEKISIFDDMGGRHDFILMYQSLQLL
jgi:hypothetical protein